MIAGLAPRHRVGLALSGGEVRPALFLAQSLRLRARGREASAFGQALRAEAAELEAAAGAHIPAGALTDPARDMELRYWDGAIWLHDARPGRRPRWVALTPEIGSAAP